MLVRRTAIYASISSVIILSGCSGERATRPVVPILPATPLSSLLVADTSAVIDGILNDEDTYEFDFSTSPLFVAREYDDIGITLAVNLFDMPDQLDVFDRRNSSWKPLDGALVTSGLYFCSMFCLGQVDRLVSEADGCAAADLVSASGQFKVRSSVTPVAPLFTARLVKFSSDYHFVSVLPTSTFQYESLAYKDGALYSSSDHENNGPAMDSIVVMNLAGERLWATGFDTPGAYVSAFDGEAFWQLKGFDGPLVRVDSSGQELATIDWPIGYARRMVWANGSIWFAQYRYTEGAPIVEVDIDSSLVLGTVVTVPRFTITREYVDAMTSDDDGLILVSGDRILRYAYDGTFLSEQTSTIPDIRAAAWDGESLWILHHGPAVAYTDATLLSRLTLE